LYLYLPPIWVLQVVTIISPLLLGSKMESSEVKDKSLPNAGTLVQRHLLKLAQKRASQPGDPPQGAGTPFKPRDVESSAEPTAGPSGLTEQGASVGKPAEVDSMVQKLPIVTTKLPGATRRKLKKALAPGA
jgi:hypothetical protein